MKKIVRIVGSGRCLGVILDREGWYLEVSYPLNSLIVEVDMGDLNFLAGSRQGIEINDKPVILGCDLHLSC